MTKHYCGSDLISVELKTETDPCCDEGMCCHSETQFFQLDEDFMASALPVDFRNMFSIDLLFMPSGMETMTMDENISSTVLPFTNPPPPRCMRTELAIRQVYLL